MLKLNREITLKAFEEWLAQSEHFGSPNDELTVHPSEDLVCACFLGQLGDVQEMISVIKGHVERCIACQHIVVDCLESGFMRSLNFPTEKLRDNFEVFKDQAKKRLGFAPATSLNGWCVQ
ncbi:hypothetical protein KKA15_06495 [Patescibacteria group bacterium]|nr:hypothetical protein [Patescibacteria group bacterium]